MRGSVVVGCAVRVCVVGGSAVRGSVVVGSAVRVCVVGGSAVRFV